MKLNIALAVFDIMVFALAVYQAASEHITTVCGTIVH